MTLTDKINSMLAETQKRTQPWNPRNWDLLTLAWMKTSDGEVWLKFLESIPKAYPASLEANLASVQVLEAACAFLKTLPPECMGRNRQSGYYPYRDEMIGRFTDTLTRINKLLNTEEAER